MSEWAYIPINAVPVEIIDGDRGKAYPKKNEFRETGHCVFLNAGNVTVDGFSFASCDFISKERDNIMRKGKLKRQDIVLTTRGTVGNVAYYHDNVQFDDIRINSGMVILRPKLGLDPQYLYLLLRSQLFLGQLNSFTTGSAQPQLPIRDIKRLEVSLPPLPAQRAIAHILGTLDDKIELNRRMNATLEAMAQAIFKSWFVDFDPVKTKMAGRQPFGMDADTAALFPDSLVDSGTELGMIPEGWEVGKLGQIAINRKKGVHPIHTDPQTPYIGLDHIPRRSIALSEWSNAGEVGSNKSRFYKGDILFGKLRPYFHKVGVAVIDGICSTDILVIAPMDETCYGLVLGYVSSDEFVAYTTAASTGTKMPRTNWRDMSSFQVVIPTADVLKRYNQIVIFLINRIEANIFESQILAALRDALLPRLMSGELRVRGR